MGFQMMPAHRLLQEGYRTAKRFKGTPSWMAPYPSNRKTRSDYRRAVEVLSRHFTVAEELDRSKCGNFLMHIGEREGVGDETIKKWRSAYLSFWKCMGKDNSIWRGLDIRSQESIHSVPQDEDGAIWKAHPCPSGHQEQPSGMDQRQKICQHHFKSIPCI